MILSDTKLLQDRLTYLNTLSTIPAEIHSVVLETASFTNEDYYKQGVGRTNHRQEGKEIFESLIRTLEDYKNKVKELEKNVAILIKQQTEKACYERELEDLFKPDQTVAASARELQRVRNFMANVGDETLTDDDVRMIMTELQGTGKPENKKAAIKHISRLATANEMSYDAAKDWLKAIIPV
jgi:hypothetical protein